MTNQNNQTQNDQSVKTLPVKTINAFCDLCDSKDEGTIKQLQAAGWDLYANAQFCGKHGEDCSAEDW